MPKGVHSGKRGRPVKGRKTSLRLSPENTEKALTIGDGLTSGIELSLRLLEIVITAAHQGDEVAISFLADIGIQVQESQGDCLIVKRPDGEIAAWIV